MLGPNASYSRNPFMLACAALGDVVVGNLFCAKASNIALRLLRLLMGSTSICWIVNRTAKIASEAKKKRRSISVTLFDIDLCGRTLASTMSNTYPRTFCVYHPALLATA